MSIALSLLYIYIFISHDLIWLEGEFKWYNIPDCLKVWCYRM